ncbi:MAG: hypothetical protein JNJ53_10845 [Rhizobiales bacterium]|nr:hypothetical protein [Hyphomicrobiales bacterium]
MALKKALAHYSGEIEELRIGDSFTLPWSWLSSTPTSLAGYGITDAMPLAGGTFTGAVTLNADPTSALQPATKQYVDGLAANLGKRVRVRAATTANIVISTALNNGDLLDGITLATGDLVLVKDQSTPAQNGIHVVGVTPARAAEFDTYNEHPGSLIAVAEGTVNADTLWLCTSNDGGTLGTSGISFSKMVIAGELLAANNLSDVASAATAFGNIKQAASDTATGAVELATTSETLTGTDATRTVTPDALAALWEKGSNVASAATVSLGEGGFFHITGTTTITDIDFATAKDGRFAWVIFDGALTLTHNATTLILPGGANILTAPGDRALFIQDSSDNVYCITYIRATGAVEINALTEDTAPDQAADYVETYDASAGVNKKARLNKIGTGKIKIPVPAAAMVPATTNGAAPGTVESPTNKIMVATLDFDATTQQFAAFSLPMPKGWNEGTISFTPIWMHPSTATNFGVVWALQALARGNDDGLDVVAYGTEQTSADTGGTTNDVYKGPESAAISVAGVPVAEDIVFFRIKRNPADAADTLAVDARLIAIELFITVDASTED